MRVMTMRLVHNIAAGLRALFRKEPVGRELNEEPSVEPAADGVDRPLLWSPYRKGKCESTLSIVPDMFYKVCHVASRHPQSMKMCLRSV